MGRAPAASPTVEVESGLGALLRAEEDLARELQAARGRAQEFVERAREEARGLRDRRREGLEAELRAVEAEARRGLEEELAVLEAEHASLVERYRAVRGERLEELARWAAARLVADLEGEEREESP